MRERRKRREGLSFSPVASVVGFYVGWVSAWALGLDSPFGSFRALEIRWEIKRKLKFPVEKWLGWKIKGSLFF